MALGQKEAVVAEVLVELPNFVKGVDNALKLLTSIQLEQIKTSIALGITSGTIEYSKNRSLSSEVKAYARSMVMNHLKKAKELNGGVKQTSTTAPTPRTKTSEAPKGVRLDLLPEELRDFARSLRS